MPKKGIMLGGGDLSRSGNNKTVLITKSATKLDDSDENEDKPDQLIN